MNSVVIRGSKLEETFPVRTLNSTKSLRPKPYTRTKLGVVGDDDLQMFLENSAKNVTAMNYNSLDNTCQLSKFERTKYRFDIKNHEIEKRLAEEERVFREYRHAEELEKTRVTHDINTQKMLDIKERWKKTQQVKQDRKTRDLRFELAKLKIEECKKEYQSYIHKRDQLNGVLGFEKIMKRTGIGAMEDGNIPLSISYEDSSAFEKRLKSMAEEKLPSNEEISDFVTQLKNRTTEKRTARYEKARRRRRAQVDQASLATEISSTSQDEV